jgi:hypothetical protein
MNNIISSSEAVFFTRLLKTNSNAYCEAHVFQTEQGKEKGLFLKVKGPLYKSGKISSTFTSTKVQM